MVDYKNFKVFNINDDFDISKVWRFAEVCLNPEIDGLRTVVNMPRITKLFKQNDVEITTDHIETILNFKSNLLDLDMYLKNVFANNGKCIKIKNMGVFELPNNYNEIHKDTGMRIIKFIGISPIHENKSGKEIARMSGDKSKVVLNPKLKK